MSKIAEKHKISGPVARPKGFSKDDEYILFSVYDSEESIDDQYYYINVESEKIYSEEEMDPINIWTKPEQYVAPSEYKYLEETNFARGELVNESGLKPVMTNSEQQIEIRPRMKSNGVEPSLLLTRYPEIQTMFDKDKDGVLFFLKNPSSGQELAELLIPEDEEPFPSNGQV